MSTPTESGANGFTAVNEGSTQDMAVKALNHGEWTNNGDANNFSPYPPLPPKRRIDEVEDTGDGARPTPPPGSSLNGSRPTETTESDARSGQGFMDEAHMAELLQGDSRNISEDQSEHLENDSPMRGSQSAVEGTSPRDSNTNSGDAPIITNAGLQVDMKKRKRAFTNRTKTGCTTCRKRKKKCDEGKPACSNCIRGGFTCLGYSQKKDLGPKGPNMTRTPNPNIAPAREGYWDQSGPRSARGPSFDDLNGLPNIHDRHPHGHDQRMGSWSNPAYPSSRPPPPPPAFAMNNRQPSYPIGGQAPMLAAHQATTHAYRDYPPRPSSADTRPANPHSGMRDNTFKPREEQYVSDRDECRLACAKFNAAMNEGSGEAEIRRRLEAIIRPTKGGASPSGAKSGTLGKGVIIDAPFRADYGYNLHIGDSCIIEGGCTIKDPASVFIGPYTRIGANVTITGEYMVHESKYSDQSKKVVVRIGKKCTIGSGVVIAVPDRTELIIGDSVYIAPGSVISSDVPSNSIIGPGPLAIPPPYDDRHMRPV